MPNGSRRPGQATRRSRAYSVERSTTAALTAEAARVVRRVLEATMTGGHRRCQHLRRCGRRRQRHLQFVALAAAGPGAISEANVVGILSFDGREFSHLFLSDTSPQHECVLRVLTGRYLSDTTGPSAGRGIHRTSYSSRSPRPPVARSVRIHRNRHRLPDYETTAFSNVRPPAAPS